jgi:hypothetical protein
LARCQESERHTPYDVRLTRCLPLDRSQFPVGNVTVTDSAVPECIRATVVSEQARVNARFAEVRRHRLVERVVPHVVLPLTQSEDSCSPPTAREADT